MLALHLNSNDNIFLGKDRSGFNIEKSKKVKDTCAAANCTWCGARASYDIGQTKKATNTEQGKAIARSDAPHYKQYQVHLLETNKS